MTDKSGVGELSAERCLSPQQDCARPTFELPTLACDCHSHVTPSSKWNLAPDASYMPAETPPSLSRQMRQALGFARGVIVQSSVFGNDNSGVLEALAGDPGGLRGVAVADRFVSDDELWRWHSLGVRGLRFIASGFGGAVNIADMVALAPRIAELGWHVEIQLAMHQWIELFPALKRLSATLVIDHMGGIPVEVDQQHESILAMRRLVRERGAFVKLISYRLGGDSQHPNIVNRVQQLYADAPKQMLWGTDWPHVMCQPMVDTGVLLNEFGCWFDHDAAALKLILETNPSHLFDF